jgi:hypothetical protein
MTIHLKFNAILYPGHLSPFQSSHMPRSNARTIYTADQTPIHNHRSIITMQSHQNLVKRQLSAKLVNEEIQDLHIRRRLS